MLLYVPVADKFDLRLPTDFAVASNIYLITFDYVVDKILAYFTPFYVPFRSITLFIFVDIITHRQLNTSIWSPLNTPRPI